MRVDDIMMVFIMKKYLYFFLIQYQSKPQGNSFFVIIYRLKFI